MKQNEMVLICPIYWVDHDLFKKNLQSWIKELPLAKIILGINNPKEFDYCNEIKNEFSIVEIKNQLHLKTLGGCLADLMRVVDTEWFVFVHADVFITPHAFKIMECYMRDDVGIIESHREHWKGNYIRLDELGGNTSWIPKLDASDYYYRDRSFSGLQIIRKDAIISLIDRLDDDYLYRNEDIIFQAECLNNNYTYEKTWAMHVHQNMNKEWTYNKEITYMMQFRGLVKYTKPTRITIPACLAAIHVLKKNFNVKIASFIAYCIEKNSNWCECIIEGWDAL